MEEKQVIVCWYTPAEKHPEEGQIVIVSMSGRISENVSYDHAFAFAEWWNDDGWVFSDIIPMSYTVHAWCDLEPYGCRKAMKRYGKGVIR